jgi:DNA-directed RNA polymerase sigma subunit (sigma70/sigma32)
MHDLHDDDSLAEALADAWIERAAVDANLRRLALRAAGLRKAPADMTTAELAAEHGITDRRLRQIHDDALLKLRHHPLCLLALHSIQQKP